MNAFPFSFQQHREGGYTKLLGSATTGLAPIIALNNHSKFMLHTHAYKYTINEPWIPRESKIKKLFTLS